MQLHVEKARVNQNEDSSCETAHESHQQPEVGHKNGHNGRHDDGPETKESLRSGRRFATQWRIHQLHEQRNAKLLLKNVVQCEHRHDIEQESCNDHCHGQGSAKGAVGHAQGHQLLGMLPKAEVNQDAVVVLDDCHQDVGEVHDGVELAWILHRSLDDGQVGLRGEGDRDNSERNRDVLDVERGHAVSVPRGEMRQTVNEHARRRTHRDDDGQNAHQVDVLHRAHKRHGKDGQGEDRYPTALGHTAVGKCVMHHRAAHDQEQRAVRELLDEVRDVHQHAAVARPKRLTKVCVRRLLEVFVRGALV